MSDSIQAVIFDYGNVLCEFQQPSDIAAMACVIEVEPDKFEKLYWKYRVAYDEAALEEEAYWGTIAHDSGVRLGSGAVSRLTELDNASWLRPKASVVPWVEKLRARGIKIGLLSNMPLTLKNALPGCDWLPEFDHSTFSCDLHISKPKLEIYRDSLKGLAVEPGASVFLDDRPDNVEGARKAGMHAIHFESPDQALQELRDICRLPL